MDSTTIGTALRRVVVPSGSLGSPRLRSTALRGALAAAFVVVTSACATKGPAATPQQPAPVEAPAALVRDRPTFPPPALVRGPVALRVQYPPAGAVVNARDSTFIFGSLGTGEATLTVNGRPVAVLPNGAWLAWLPVPPRERPVYDLVAVRGDDTTRATHTIRYPSAPAMLPASGPRLVDSTSVTPRLPFARLSTDTVAVSVVVAPGATVQLRLGNEVVRRADQTTSPGFQSNPLRPVLPVPATLLARGDARLVVTRGNDTVSLGIPRIALADSGGRQWATAGARTAGDSGRVVIARPVSGGTYKWFLFPGTTVEYTGRQGNQARIRLAPGLDAWIDAAELDDLAPGKLPVPLVAGNARVVARAGYSELVIPLAARPAWSVDERDDQLDLTLYRTTANTDIINFASADSVIRRVTWEQAGEGRAVYHVSLREPSYGYVVRWEREALVLRVRRAPRIDPARPLAGLVIAVDPGHPPIGSTGPTGLYEGDATLAIAGHLKPLLESRGATVFMTRTTRDAVDLGARQPLASNAGAHAFVSIHLNALPDGMNPFTSHGTGTYWFNASSSELARQVQAGMVRRMGLRDLGTNYDNLAVLRPSWMPSVLCEGAFVMMPEQEALLRTPAFQQAYALGVAEGVEGYFRALGRAQREGGGR